jgi:hypothetical protein
MIAFQIFASLAYYVTKIFGDNLMLMATTVEMRNEKWYSP